MRAGLPRSPLLRTLRTGAGAVLNAPTIADAIRAQARVLAAKSIIKEAEDEIRAFLNERADEIEAQTGAAANFPIKGVGRAYRTQPSYRLDVTDDLTLAKYVESRGFGEVRRRVVVDSAALQYDLDRGDEDSRTWLADRGYLREEAVLDDDARDRLLLLPRMDDGTLVDPDTGEGLPARAIARSKPSLTITPEKAVKAEAREQLVGSLRPALQAGGSDAGS